MPLPNMTGQWAGSWGQRPADYGNQSLQSYFTGQFNNDPRSLAPYINQRSSLGGMLRGWFPGYGQPGYGRPNTPPQPPPSTGYVPTGTLPATGYGGEGGGYTPPPNIFNNPPGGDDRTNVPATPSTWSYQPPIRGVPKYGQPQINQPNPPFYTQQPPTKYEPGILGYRQPGGWF